MMDNNKIFKYSKEEDQLNAYSHLIGAVLSIIGFIYLMVSHNDVAPLIKFGVFIYTLSMFLLFMASYLYHNELDRDKRIILKRFDHAMILVMISGSYVPYCLIMGTSLSYLVLTIVYLLSIIGTIIKVKYVHINKLVSISIYLIVGWLAIFMIKDIINFFDPIVIRYMLLGGITYSLGAIMYAIAKFKYHHALWHIFVLLAAIFFFISINFALY